MGFRYRQERVAAKPGERGPDEIFMVPEETFTKARDYLWRMNGADGFGYTEPRPITSMTAVGTFCSYLLGCYDDPRIQKALRRLDTATATWEGTWNGVSCFWYGCYFLTQANFQAGGYHWSHWNELLQQNLLNQQAADGHWSVRTERAPAGLPNHRRLNALEANNFENGSTGGSPAYATALGAMIFEAYYRYPRISQMGFLSESAASRAATRVEATAAPAKPMVRGAVIGQPAGH